MPKESPAGSGTVPTTERPAFTAESSSSVARSAIARALSESFAAEAAGSGDGANLQASG
jgi:hypothetical protein